MDILAPIWIYPVYLLAIMHTNAFCWRNAAQLAHQALVGWVILLSCTNLLCLRGVLRLPQLGSSSPGLRGLQPWVRNINLKSCFLSIFKQSMKLRVENLTKWPPAINPAQSAVCYRLCKELFFGLKNPFQYLSSKDCTSQKDFLFIWLGSSFLWEKNLWLIQAILKCQYTLSNAWSTSVSLQGIDRTSDINEYRCVNMCTHSVMVQTWWHEALNKCAMTNNKSIFNVAINYYISSI